MTCLLAYKSSLLKLHFIFHEQRLIGGVQVPFEEAPCECQWVAYGEAIQCLLTLCIVDWIFQIIKMIPVHKNKYACAQEQHDILQIASNQSWPHLRCCNTHRLFSVHCAHCLELLERLREHRV